MPQQLTLDPASVSVSVGDPSAWTVTLTNTSGAEMDLVAGTPVAEGSALSSTAAALYVTLGSLVTAEQWGAATVAVPGWTPQFFADAGVSGTWALCPQTDATLAPNDDLELTISGLALPGPVRPGGLAVDYYNFVAGSFGIGNAQMLLQEPPSGQSTAPPMTLAWDGEEPQPPVYTTLDVNDPIENTLSFIIAADFDRASLVDPPTPNGGRFIVSFAVGDGDGALTEADWVSPIELQLAAGSDLFGIERGVDGNYWTLTPTSYGILDQEDVVTFELTGIRTDADLDADGDVAGLFLQWTDIPGYDDGSSAIFLRRLPGPMITGITYVPATLETGTSFLATIHWQGVNVAAVSFSSGGVSYPGEVSVTDSGSDAVNGTVVAALTAGATVDVLASGTGGSEGTPYVTTSVFPATDPTSRCYLRQGAFITTGGYLQSPAGAYDAFVQQDANLVVQAGSTPVWWAIPQSQPSGDYFLWLDSTGTLTMYEGTDPDHLGAEKWRAVCYGDVTSIPGPYWLRLQDDGNLTLFGWPAGGNWGAAWWSTRPPTLLTNQYLPNDSPAFSSDYHYMLIQQSDGNLCIYEFPFGPSNLVWCSGKAPGGGPYYTIMQSDGNLVTYAAEYGAPITTASAVWSAKSNASGGEFFAELGTDGVLRVHSGTPNAPGKEHWHS